MEYKKFFSPETIKKLDKKSAENLKTMLGDKTLTQTMLSSQKLLNEISKAEAPYKGKLEKLAVKIVKELYPIIDEEYIKLDAKLGDIGSVTGGLDEITINDPTNFKAKFKALNLKAGDKVRLEYKNIPIIATIRYIKLAKDDYFHTTVDNYEDADYIFFYFEDIKGTNIISGFSDAYYFDRNYQPSIDLLKHLKKINVNEIKIQNPKIFSKEWSQEQDDYFWDLIQKEFTEPKDEHDQPFYDQELQFNDEAGMFYNPNNGKYLNFKQAYEYLKSLKVNEILVTPPKPFTFIANSDYGNGEYWGELQSKNPNIPTQRTRMWKGNQYHEDHVMVETPNFLNTPEEKYLTHVSQNISHLPAKYVEFVNKLRIKESISPESKRRVINSVTQGAALRGAFAFYLFKEHLDEIDPSLVEKYNQIMKNSFGIYDDPNAVAMMLSLLAQGHKSAGGTSKVILKEIKVNDPTYTKKYKSATIKYFQNLQELNQDIIVNITLDNIIKEIEKLTTEKEINDLIFNNFFFGDNDPGVLEDFEDTKNEIKNFINEIYINKPLELVVGEYYAIRPTPTSVRQVRYLGKKGDKHEFRCPGFANILLPNEGIKIKIIKKLGLDEIKVNNPINVSIDDIFQLLVSLEVNRVDYDNSEAYYQKVHEYNEFNSEYHKLKNKIEFNYKVDNETKNQLSNLYTKMKQFQNSSIKEIKINNPVNFEKIWDKCWQDAIDEIGIYEENEDGDEGDEESWLENEDDVSELANQLFKEKTGKNAIDLFELEEITVNPPNLKSPLRLKSKEEWERIFPILNSKGYKWVTSGELKNFEPKTYPCYLLKQFRNKELSISYNNQDNFDETYHALFESEQSNITIQARAINFPMLVHELIKGLYELISLQGFKGDKATNQAVVNKVDLLKHEPEDIKYGKFIYDALNDVFASSKYNDPRIREFFFTDVYKLDDNDFLEFIENAINENLTSEQKRWVENTLKSIENDLKSDDYNKTGMDENKNTLVEIFRRLHNLKEITVNAPPKFHPGQKVFDKAIEIIATLSKDPKKFKSIDSRGETLYLIDDEETGQRFYTYERNLETLKEIIVNNPNITPEKVWEYILQIGISQNNEKLSTYAKIIKNFGWKSGNDARSFINKLDKNTLNNLYQALRKAFGNINEITINNPTHQYVPGREDNFKDFEKGKNVKQTIINLLKVNPNLSEKQIREIIVNKKHLYGEKTINDAIRYIPEIDRVVSKNPITNKKIYVYYIYRSPNIPLNEYSDKTIATTIERWKKQNAKVDDNIAKQIIQRFDQIKGSLAQKLNIVSLSDELKQNNNYLNIDKYSFDDVVKLLKSLPENPEKVKKEAVEKFVKQDEIDKPTAQSYVARFISKKDTLKHGVENGLEDLELSKEDVKKLIPKYLLINNAYLDPRNWKWHDFEGILDALFPSQKVAQDGDENFASIDSDKIYDKDGLEIYKGDDVHKCISYNPVEDKTKRKKYGWCVTQVGNTNYDYYRFEERSPTFYFIFNREKTSSPEHSPFQDKWHAFVIQANKDGKTFAITNANNNPSQTNVENWEKLSQVVDKDTWSKIKNLKSYFKPIGLSSVERGRKLSSGKNLSLEEFKELAQDEKILYIQGKASQNKLPNDILKILPQYKINLEGRSTTLANVAIDSRQKFPYSALKDNEALAKRYAIVSARFYPNDPLPLPFIKYLDDESKQKYLDKYDDKLTFEYIEKYFGDKKTEEYVDKQLKNLDYLPSGALKYIKNPKLKQLFETYSKLFGSWEFGDTTNIDVEKLEDLQNAPPQNITPKALGQKQWSSLSSEDRKIILELVDKYNQDLKYITLLYGLPFVVKDGSNKYVLVPKISGDYDNWVMMDSQGKVIKDNISGDVTLDSTPLNFGYPSEESKYNRIYDIKNLKLGKEDLKEFINESLAEFIINGK
jgi:hypothetical protein